MINHDYNQLSKEFRQTSNHKLRKAIETAKSYVKTNLVIKETDSEIKIPKA